MTSTTILAFIILNIGKRFIKEKIETSSEDEITIGH